MARPVSENVLTAMAIINKAMQEEGDTTTALLAMRFFMNDICHGDNYDACRALEYSHLLMGKFEAALEYKPLLLLVNDFVLTIKEFNDVNEMEMTIEDFVGHFYAATCFIYAMNALRERQKEFTVENMVEQIKIDGGLSQDFIYTPIVVDTAGIFH